MSWQIEFAPEVEQDMTAASNWYEARQAGLGLRFTEEIIRVWDDLTDNPLLGCRRHPTKNLHWRYPESFPYRVIYEVDETRQIVRVAAVLHAARSEEHWQRRIK
jgi:plasmid stabilization system protein ParE